MFNKIKSVPAGKSLFLSGKTLTILFLLIAAQANSQWLTDVRMTNDPGISNTSENNARCIASNAFIVCVVWFDERNGNTNIYYKRSLDGVSWGPETQLTNTSSYYVARYPSVAVSGLLTPTVHVVWSQFIGSSNYEIYYRRSVGGLNWGASTRLTYADDFSMYPSIAVSGTNVHVVWEDYRDLGDIYYKRSVDGGVSWATDVKIVAHTIDFVPQRPSVSASGSDVHVVYYRNVLGGGNYEIYYKRTVDNGISWGGEVRLTNANYNSYHPCVSASGSNVHVVWHDVRDGNAEVYYKRSTNRGLNWGADTRLTNNSANSGFPSVSLSGPYVHLVWYDTRDGNTEIYYKRSTNYGVSWGADTRLTNNTYASAYPSVAVALSSVHVVWQDFRNGNYEIYYKRNPTGNPVGIKNINSEVPKEFSLGQNYPNPFNPSTVINFQLKINSFVTLKIYDILGNEVSTLVNENLQAGSYEVNFDGSKLSSGVYSYRFEAGNFTDVKKMVILK